MRNYAIVHHHGNGNGHSLTSYTQKVDKSRSVISMMPHTLSLDPQQTIIRTDTAIPLPACTIMTTMTAGAMRQKWNCHMGDGVNRPGPMPHFFFSRVANRLCVPCISPAARGGRRRPAIRGRTDNLQPRFRRCISENSPSHICTFRRPANRACAPAVLSPRMSKVLSRLVRVSLTDAWLKCAKKPLSIASFSAFVPLLTVSIRKSGVSADRAAGDSDPCQRAQKGGAPKLLVTSGYDARAVTRGAIWTSQSVSAWYYKTLRKNSADKWY